MPITGDWEGLEAVRRAVDTVASAGFRTALNKNLSEAALTEIKLGFAEGVDPTGAAWAPLKRRPGLPLRDTGRLGNSFRRTACNAGGFTVTSGVGYGLYHQTGTRRMPARKMVPESQLPDRYKAAFNEVATDMLEQTLAAK